MIVVSEPINSPWFPLVLGNLLSEHAKAATKATGMVHVDVPFPQWLAWRAHLVIPPQSTENMLAHVHAALGILPQ